MRSPWSILQPVPSAQLVEARLQLHWAAQLAAAPGATLVEEQADFAHLSLALDADRRAFEGPVVTGGRPWRAALRLAPPQLELRDAGGRTIERLDLAGRTLAEGRAWLQAAAERWTSQPLARDLALPEQRPADHPVAAGAAFDVPARHAEVLAAWYAATAELLDQVREHEATASPARLWPHHFDQAVLIDLRNESGLPDDASVGVGFSPGDDGRSAPYLYGTPWPHPEARDLPELPAGGTWNTEGWVGAVLTAEAVLALEPGERAARVAEFAAAAVAGGRALLAR